MTKRGGPLFQHVLLVGTGLLGASLGLALRRRGLAVTVTGWDRSPQHLAEARRLGAIAADRPQPDATGADLVVVATPVGAMPAMLTQLSGTLAPGTIVTDVGSTKADVVAAAASLPAEVTFVGGHPMAGRAVSGPAAADADLFAGRRWVLCPAGHSPAEQAAVARLTALVRALGAEPVLRTPLEHDRQVATVSHLPQLLSSALALAAETTLAEDPAGFELAATGWQDMTRLAGSSPDMWRDICLSNREALSAALAAYRHVLDRFAAAVAAADGAALAELLTAARDAKLRRTAAGGSGRAAVSATEVAS